MRRSLASFCNGSVIGPGMGQQALSIHSAAGKPCGGPCSENSGSTTRRAGSGPRVAASIRPITCAVLLLIVAHAPVRSVALTASLLLVWMQVARHGSIVIA